MSEQQGRGLLLRALRILILVTIPAGAVAVAALVSFYFVTNRPQAQRRPPAPMAALVDVLEVSRGSHQVTVPVMGTVIPAVEVSLQARVTGEVVEKHPDFVAGGLVEAGDVVIRIESEDYQLALASRKAQLETARYELRSEESQQQVARREWELLGMNPDDADGDSELALRGPQLRQKQAALAAAEAQMELARLDLERTVVRAPFNGIVRSAEVDVGDLATPQARLGTIVNAEVYWVRVSIPVDDLRWVDVPIRTGGPSSEVLVHSAAGGVRTGRVLSLLSDLEPEGRMARLLVEVPDPLGLDNGSATPLLLGEHARAEVLGRTVDDVFAVPWGALRNGGEVWVLDADETLSIVPVEVVWSDPRQAFVRGLEDGAHLIVSDLATPVPGMPLRDSREPDTDRIGLEE